MDGVWSARAAGRLASPRPARRDMEEERVGSQNQGTGLVLLDAFFDAPA